MVVICRTCLSKINNSNFFPLKGNSISGVIKNQLALCMPEIVIDKVANPVMCYSCVNALHTTFNFKYNCLRTEEQINIYSQKLRCSRRINLLGVIPKDGDASKEPGFVTTVLNSNKKRFQEVISNAKKSTSKFRDLLDNQMPKLEPIYELKEQGIKRAEDGFTSPHTCDLEKWNRFENNHLDGAELIGDRSTRAKRARRTRGKGTLKAVKHKKEATINNAAVVLNRNVNLAKHLKETKRTKHHNHMIQPMERALQCNICAYITNIEVDMELHSISHMNLESY